MQTDLPHGLYVLQLRDRVVPLLAIPPPPRTKGTAVHYLTIPEHARVLLNDCGADGDGFVAAIPPDEYLPDPA